MSAIAPVVSQPNVDGMFWYTFGAGYSGWSGTEWYTTSDGQHSKPVIGMHELNLPPTTIMATIVATLMMLKC